MDYCTFYSLRGAQKTHEFVNEIKSRLHIYCSIFCMSGYNLVNRCKSMGGVDVMHILFRSGSIVRKLMRYRNNDVSHVEKGGGIGTHGRSNRGHFIRVPWADMTSALGRCTCLQRLEEANKTDSLPAQEKRNRIWKDLRDANTENRKDWKDYSVYWRWV